MERNSSLDLLRVLAMFMILTLHFFGWGGAVNVLTTHDLNYYIVMPIYFVSGIGNTLFFLLSGYFMGMPKLEKAIFLERKTAFYSFIITLIAFIGGLNTDGGWEIKYLIKSELPILFNKYWFITVYFILYVFSAVLYKGLKQLSNQMILVIIGILLINNTFIYDANMTFMQGLLTVIVGYYLRSVQPFQNWSKLRVLVCYIVTLIVYVAERIFVQRIGTEHGSIDTMLRYVLILWMAVWFFSLFEKFQIKWKWPSKISKHIVAVYLISANPVITTFLYVEVLSMDVICIKMWFFIWYLAVNIIIFGMCILIDFLVSRVNQLETRKWLQLCEFYIKKL